MAQFDTTNVQHIPSSKLAAVSRRTPSKISSKPKCFSPPLTKIMTRRYMTKTIKHVFSVLYHDKTWVFDQSERPQGPIYIAGVFSSTARPVTGWFMVT